MTIVNEYVLTHNNLNDAREFNWGLDRFLFRTQGAKGLLLYSIYFLNVLVLIIEYAPDNSCK